jgi:hypothetical protein
LVNKDTRYTLPYLPALAVLSALGLAQIRTQWVRRAGLALLLFYALVQYSGLTVGLSNRVAALPVHVEWVVGPVPLAVYSEQIHIASPARSEEWQIDAILEAVRQDVEQQAVVAAGGATRSAQSVAPPPQLLVVPSATYFEPQAFIYSALRDGLRVEIALVTGIVEIDSMHVIERADYVVTKSGNLGWSFVLQEAETLTAALLDPTSPLGTRFARIAEFPLPDGSVALLFRQMSQESPESQE